MGSPIKLVKLFVKEADSYESCVKCGWKGKGLSSFVVYIYYIDPFTGHEMIMGFSFPLCQEHISEEMKKYPADKEYLTQKSSSNPEDKTGADIKPPPFSRYYFPNAN